MMLPFYAYKESDGSVTIYKDELGKNVFCRFDNNNTNKPTKRNKRITLQCWTWNLFWITFRFTTFEEYLQLRLKDFE